eukprot:527968-Prymnesium_polylepis.1
MAASSGHLPAFGPPPTPDSLVNKRPRWARRPRLLHACTDPTKKFPNPSRYGATVADAMRCCCCGQAP